MFLGIDCGTQGTKIVLLDLEQKKIIAQGHAPHTLDSNPQGGREQHPQIWIDALRKAFASMVKDYHLSHELKAIKGIGVSGQQHGLVVLDKDGKVIRPAKLWCDTETAPENQALIEKLGGHDAFFEQCGLEVMPGYTASKLLWLKEKEPENYRQVTHILLPHDYINFFLSGEIACEPGDSSGTGYYDVRKRNWSKEILQAIDGERDLLSCLPRLIENHQPVGVIKKSLAEEWGLSPSVLIASGGGDNMMGAIGSGNIKPGIMTMSLGTSGTLFTRCEQFLNIPPTNNSAHRWIANFCSSDGGWLPLTCHMNVTATTNLVQNLLKIDLPTFFQLAEQAQGGAGGINLLPFFNGERVPNLPQAEASFNHLTTDNFTPENLARAAIEGASFSVIYGYHLFQKAGMDFQQIRLIGGGSKSEFWCQLMANLTNREVITLVQEEGAALGAALQAGWNVENHNGEREIASIAQEVITPKKHYAPDPASVKRYQGIYERYEKDLQSHFGIEG